MFELAIWLTFGAAVLFTIALGITVALDAQGRGPQSTPNPRPRQSSQPSRPRSASLPYTLRRCATS